MSDNETQFLSVIRVWAALAWADGIISEAESVAMRRLIAAADLSDEERSTALSWLDSKVELDTTNIASLTDQARRGIYRAAAQLAAVDLDVAEAEVSFLQRLRTGLKIADDVAAEIEASIPGYRRK
ncbi:MAG: DUF533 domain-containing protein [Myxococcota bacterium]